MKEVLRLKTYKIIYLLYIFDIYIYIFLVFRELILLDEIPTVHAYVATKKLHHNDYDLKHFSQVFSMQFMAKFGACQARLLENIEIRNLCHDPF